MSNVDSVVGCSLKLFGSLARDFFATLPKVNMKVEISELQPGILLFVMNIATGFVISCGEVFQCSKPSSLLQRLFPADVGVTNRRPSSNSELISRMEMRLPACVTRGPSREPYQTVSTVYFILGILRTDLWSQGN